MKNQLKLHSYSWTGKNAQKDFISGEIQAISLNFAKMNLQQQGIELQQIKKAQLSLTKFLPQKITTLDLIIFFRQLSTLISAGVPILQSCETLRHSQKNAAFQQILDSIKQEIEAGKGFSTSLRQFPRVFNDFTLHLLQAGEQSGTLEIMLNRLSIYYEKLWQMKKRVQQALFYPAIIMIVATLVTIVMLLVVVPRFESLFESMHGELPAFTRAVIGISQWIRNQSWFLLVFPVIAIGLMRAVNVKLIRCKQHFDLLVLKLPGLKTILQKIILARFARCMATLYSSGIPMMDALKISAQVSGNHAFTQAILYAQTSVASGKQLHTTLSEKPIFPPLVVNMIKVGEETGSLDNMLNKIAELYEADIDHLIANLSHLLEPLIMTILGVLIGGLVVAMYLPIFKLGTVI